MNVLPIAEKIEIAMETLKRLPPGHFPTYKISQWPDYMRDFWELWRLYNSESAYDKPLRLTPTAQQISVMNEVILWPLEFGNQIPKDTWRIIFARCGGAKWKFIELMVGSSRRVCWERFRVGLAVLSYLTSIKNSESEKKLYTMPHKNAISDDRITETYHTV